MKLTQKTFSILKNFSSINQSLYVTKGNTLRTISEMKSVIADVDVQEMFPRDFGIYDLNQFLGVISLFEEPDLDFDTTFVRVSGSQGASSNYFYADKATIRTIPPEKSFELPDTVETFSVTDKVVKGVLQAANVLQLPEIAIVGDGIDITIEAVNTKNSTSNSFRYEVGKTKKKFKMIFKVENIKMMMGGYNVSISSKKITQFKAVEGTLTYTIVNEASSTYEG
jgi:hypothetical protein